VKVTEPQKDESGDTGLKSHPDPGQTDITDPHFPIAGDRQPRGIFPKTIHH
jgi:hypothetical protein